MTRLIVSTACLLAASVAVSTEETYYYLCGVAIQPHPVKGVVLLATDGHRMMVVHDEHGYTPRDCILSMDWKAKGLKVPKKEIGQRVLSIDIGEKTRPGNQPAEIRGMCSPDGADRWDEGTLSDTIMVQEVDGTFPEWQRVIPWRAIGLKQSAPVDLCFNPRYFADFAPAFSILSDTDRPVLDITAYKQDAPMIVTHAYVPNAFGILMPARGEKKDLPFIEPWRAEFAPKRRR